MTGNDDYVFVCTQMFTGDDCDALSGVMSGEELTEAKRTPTHPLPRPQQPGEKHAAETGGRGGEISLEGARQQDTATNPAEMGKVKDALATLHSSNRKTRHTPGRILSSTATPPESSVISQEQDEALTYEKMPQQEQVETFASPSASSSTAASPATKRPMSTSGAEGGGDNLRVGTPDRNTVLVGRIHGKSGSGTLDEAPFSKTSSLPTPPSRPGSRSHVDASSLYAVNAAGGGGSNPWLVGLGSPLSIRSRERGTSATASPESRTEGHYPPSAIGKGELPRGESFGLPSAVEALDGVNLGESYSGGSGIATRYDGGNHRGIDKGIGEKQLDAYSDNIVPKDTVDEILFLRPAMTPADAIGGEGTLHLSAGGTGEYDKSRYTGGGEKDDNCAGQNDGRRVEHDVQERDPQYNTEGVAMMKAYLLDLEKSFIDEYGRMEFEYIMRK